MTWRFVERIKKTYNERKGLLRDKGNNNISFVGYL